MDFVQKKDDPSTVNQLLSLIQDLQDEVSALNEENFYDTETASSSGLSHVPSQPSRIPSLRGMLSRDSGLPHFSRNSMGTSGNVFENLPAPERRSPSLPGIAMRHGEGLRGEPQSSTIPTPRFSRNLDAWNSVRHTGGTYFQNCTMEAPRFLISKLHFGKFPDPDDFRCWRANFKTEVCVSTSSPELAMSWINEVEMAGSIDDLMTSQSIEGQSFPAFEMLDARIASALRNIISSTSSRRIVSVEEQRAHKYNRFLRGRSIACLIHGHFQSTGAYDTAHGLSDLFSICLKDDDVQDFDSRWDQIKSGKK